MKNSFPSVILSVAKNLAMLSIAAVMFGACGDEGGTNAGGDDDESSSSVVSSDSEGSSSSAKKESSSSVILSSSSEGSSSSAKSSSSVASSSSAKSSSSTAKSSSSVASSSSAKSSSSSANSSSSSVKISSSSEYVPFDHSKTHAAASKVGADAYKQFTDERNGRSYYYITIEGETPGGVDATVTIMAENLNIGTMVNGENDQNNDDVIERYCYDNDTTKCDEFGGLYQWAEMMQLPSRCNTESCADLIENKHRGICPDGWRLMTYRDFYIAWHAKTNTDGIAGVRSSWGFTGSNESGLSLTGAGRRSSVGVFENIKDIVYWKYPEEKSETASLANYVMRDSNTSPQQGSVSKKVNGASVRCVMVENAAE